MYEGSGLKENDSLKLLVLFLGISLLLSIAILHQQALAIINTAIVNDTFSLGSNVTSSLGAAGSTIRIDKSLYGLGDIIEVPWNCHKPSSRKKRTIRCIYS